MLPTMFGLRSAQGRVAAVVVLFVLLLVGISLVAAQRAAADHAADTTLWLLMGFGTATFLVAAGTAGMLLVSVIRPLASLRATARAITSGDLESRAEVCGPEEVASLARAFNEMTDALSAKTKEYIDTVNLTGDIILRLDKDGRFTFLNDAGCAFFGKPREELLGTDGGAFLPPEDRERAAQAVLEVIESKGLVSGFVSRLATPGGMRVVEWNASLFFDEEGQYAGIQMTGRDITERQKAEEGVRESEKRVRAQYKGIPVPTYTWRKVGEGSFGIAKEDAILPGVDWAIKDEWTSGTDWFKDPWAMKFVPHPNKITMPVMAISHKGTGIGLSWDPHQVATRWFNYRPHVPQPVFASPNFIDRMNNQVMGLMVPDATIEGHENEVYAEIPLELKIDQMVNFDAEVWISEGSSMEVITDWIGRNGFPDPGEPRWSYKETLDKIANAYNTNLWHEGEGFGYHQRPGRITPNVPGFLDRYIRENKKTTLAKELRQKVEWSRTQMGDRPGEPGPEILKKQGDELLKLQRADGSFVFDPEGRHWRKDDFMVATSFIEPMGLANDTALEIVMLPAIQLLDISNQTGEKKYADAARRAFDYCMHMTRPEAGDYWETPIHAANLLAAGHAAIGYYEAYRKWGDEKYRDKAIYWIRTLIPFTHLWETEQVKMLYNTKPVLSSSDWYFANWVRDHVQWEVLRVFIESVSREIYWGDIDPQIDWDRYHEGVTTAVIRWMIIHTEDTWRPHNLPDTWEGYINGDFDYTYPDTHNSVTGKYGGMFIGPDPIAVNIYNILDRRKKK